MEEGDQQARGWSCIFNKRKKSCDTQLESVHLLKPPPLAHGISYTIKSVQF